MKIRLLADVHISLITIAQLQQAGYEINRITDYLPANASDVKIIDLALQKEAFIITQDLDFSAIIAQSGLHQPSVISFRVDNAKPQIISKIS